MSESGWNTIDSDAGVFTELVEKLQVKNIQFEDLYSIDSDSLKALSPLHGVVFLFKYGKKDRESQKNGNLPLAGTYDVNYQENGIFFANQTIQNACATQAVLNILFNNKDIELGEELTNFKSFVGEFDSELIGESISNSELIRSVHNSFSAPQLIVGDEKKPRRQQDDKDDGLFHFIGYLRIGDFIYELDGLKQYPIKHVSCTSDDDFLKKLPGVIQERISIYGNEELRFSLLGITQNRLQHFQDIGNYQGFSEEMMKRETWKRENELRKHDYVPIIFQLLKNIGGELSQNEWEKLLVEGSKKTQARMLEEYRNR